MSNVEGDSNYVRVQGLTNSGAMDRGKQLAVVRQLTEIIAVAVAAPAARTWVLFTEAPGGGWGLAGHANTSAESGNAARTDHPVTHAPRQGSADAEDSAERRLRALAPTRALVTECHAALGPISRGSAPLCQEAAV